MEKGGITMTVEQVAALSLVAMIGFLAHYLVRRDPESGVEDLAAIVGELANSR